jgi:acyl-CoA thioester hydrolase
MNKMAFEEFEIKNTYQIRVRYADTDQMGVVYNGNYFKYFEIARTELMRKTGMPYKDFEAAGWIFPLVEAHANFIKSAHYDDLLDVETIVKVEYKPLVTFKYNIFRSDSTITTGYTVHSFVSKETQKPVKPPSIFWEVLARLKNLKD